MRPPARPQRTRRPGLLSNVTIFSLELRYPRLPATLRPAVVNLPYCPHFGSMPSAIMIESTEFVLPGLKEDGGLTNAYVRYKPMVDGNTIPDPHYPRVSLLLLHSVASHKEAWFPMVEHLFELQRTAPTNGFTIVEVWAMDSPNHGHAARLNDSLLRDFPNGITGMHWARAANLLLTSGLMASGCAVVGVGHSAGSCIIVQSTDGYPLDRLLLSSIIMVEPPMMTRDILRRAQTEGAPVLRAAEGALVRKDVWSSRAAAKEWFAKRIPWKRWDPRAFELFIEHGLLDLPTAAYPDTQQGVTLAASRVQESWGYSHHEDGFAALDRLSEICSTIPVHCVFGAVNDFIPVETQAGVMDESAGRRMRSIVRVAGAGHLVLQENPQGLALGLWGILHLDAMSSVGIVATGSKL
ncbi:alpha/beta-hydrolase [Trametes meyenii]|nr:alpha/beta-hydrolase [Trametes meyenii]